MDYFVLFYTILGTAVSMALMVVALVIVLTSREVFPPLPKRSPKAVGEAEDAGSEGGVEPVSEMHERLVA